MMHSQAVGGWAVVALAVSCGASRGDETRAQRVTENGRENDGTEDASTATGEEPAASVLTGDSGPLTFEECEGLSQQAQAALNDALSDVPLCKADADCVGHEMPTHCWDSCSTILVASTAYLEALEDALSDGVAGDHCAEFSKGACVVARHSCPIPGPPEDIAGYFCVDQECVAVVADGAYSN